MRVAELMQTNLQTVRPDASIADATVLLADSHVTGVPVVDGRGRVLGVMTTTDVLNAAAETTGAEERERLFEQTTVQEIMTPRPLTITPDTEVKEAAQQMLYLEVHRLFVEDDGHLVGVISQSDIVRAVALARI
ncbi:MAG TPA: CBS domain-containing protein [Gemmatimonadales bacterium]|jgi:CBS domain-containing protein|nr:CBS domain-containing protein [Gemmatimonadales bacterium]